MRRAKIQTEDGTILRAYLHSPGPGEHPGIVMCPGFGGVKQLIDPYAALFAEAGFAVLNFDNRGWGTSEGEPRQELNVFKQLTDLRDAITFAETQPEFAPQQGSGGGGGVSQGDWRSSPPPMIRGSGVWSRRFRTSVVTEMRSSCFPPSTYTRSAAEPQSTGSLAWLANLR